MDRLRSPNFLLGAISCASLSTAVAAQGGIQSPGMPTFGQGGRSLTQYLDGSGAAAESGQTDRFAAGFNPAIGLSLDAYADWVDSDESGADGGSIELRSTELTAGAWVDPSAWAYAVLVAAEDEIGFEEAAVKYVGFDSNLTLKAGRFFVDFGKQMQVHIHDLRTFERPLALREYIGDELGGDGVQLDNWFSVGDAPVRYSVAVFQSLLGEAEEEQGPAAFEEERKGADEFAFSARLTGLMDVGERGSLQLGASVRHLPEFGFEFSGSGSSVDGLSNAVYGLDATYGWTDETGERKYLVGGEWLLANGDLAATLDDSGTPGDESDDVVGALDDDAMGFYAFGDFAWNRRNSVGLQYSRVETAADPDSEASQLDLYYTRNLSEFQRLRVSAIADEADDGGDGSRLVVQYTAFLGAHSHGVSW